jgi:ParB family chromosome partitioning protein
MSRTLEVGRLPSQIVDAFADSRTVTARHAGQLAPSLRQPRSAAQMLEAAARIAAERTASGQAMAPHQVVSALLAAAVKPTRRLRAPTTSDILARNGRPMLRVEGKGKGGDLTIRVLPQHAASREELHAAVLGVLDSYFCVKTLANPTHPKTLPVSILPQCNRSGRGSGRIAARFRRPEARDS